jgi:hypothetical protein
VQAGSAILLFEEGPVPHGTFFWHKAPVPAPTPEAQPRIAYSGRDAAINPIAENAYGFTWPLILSIHVLFDPCIEMFEIFFRMARM